MLEHLQTETVAVQQQVLAEDSEKEFRWTVMAVNSDNISTVLAYTSKARPRKASDVKTFLLNS